MTKRWERQPEGDARVSATWLAVGKLHVFMQGDIGEEASACLSRDDAIALARFILDAAGEGNP